MTEVRAKVDQDYYDTELARLQIELVKQQEYIRAKGLRVVVLFEGRDAAGKGGAIQRITEALNPRAARVVALAAPTERERGQWYFQRYVAHLPAAGEMVLFDRSWYNRAGVEHVMGFCTDEEYREFLRSVPELERMLVRSGIQIIKYWFSISDVEQERRFQGRLKNPAKRWKLSPDGPRGPQPLGRLLPRQGRHARGHRHPGGAVVGGRGRGQEAGPAQRHHPPAGAGALRGPDAARAEAAAAARSRSRTTSGRRARSSTWSPTSCREQRRQALAAPRHAVGDAGQQARAGQAARLAPVGLAVEA
jgi:polyphosphate kinase 2